MLIGRCIANGTITYATVDSHGSATKLVTDPFGHPGDVMASEALLVGGVRWLPPVQPRQILAAAVNYASHAVKRNPTGQPELFFKAPASTVGSGDVIVLPEGARQVEAEGELVAVIGRTAHRVTVEEAPDYVLGYTCGIDVSAREWQRADRQFWRAKGADTFSPIGPFIATDLDPSACTLTTRVNGGVRQQTRTSELLYSVAELIEFASRYVTLQPGDLIFTGTPGTTPEITPGDRVEVEITGIGTLVCSVAAELANHLNA